MPKEPKDRNDIVSHAIEIASEEERAAYIAEACGNDAEKKRQVEKQVAEHFQSGDQEKPERKANNDGRSAEQTGASHVEGQEHPTTRIGPYKVVKPIGEGVASIVFQGEQEEPEQQKVALKVIKDSRNWRQIVARFETERQTLSRINHPNIAKLLGHGTRESGQPYFVMELVEGLPVTKFCDEHQLSLQPRLELFVSVCQAVQHAHQKGIIHGALKPSNVLVISQDDKPVPKILDLGIAKAMRQELNKSNPSLDPGLLGGKPEYLSPEQADADAPDIDTRSDVYSLGVLLYELLTGTTPLTSEHLKDVSRTETLRLVREKEIPAPSDRLNESQDRLSSVAKRCQMKPKKLMKAVRGDLDCVVKKALQKNRKERYETVHELARDIQRYLADAPLEACPPSGARQLWKLAKKDSMTLAMAAGVLLLLLAAAIGGGSLGIWEWRKENEARKAEQNADEQRKQAEEKEKESQSKLRNAELVAEIRQKERDKAREVQQAAQKSENRTKGILDFLKKQLMAAGRPGDVSLANAFWAGTRRKEDATVRKKLTLLEAVDETASKVAGMLANQPLAEAEVREMLGFAYMNLGEAAKAVQQYKRALELRKAMKGVDDPATAECNNQLAIAYRLASLHDQASRLFHRTPRSPAEADALATRGSTLLMEKKPAEAELAFRDCLDIRKTIQPDDWTTFETESLLGESLLEQKKYTEAESRLLSGYKGMQDRVSKMPDEGKVQLTKAVERLVRLYDSWGAKLDEVAKWRRELEIIKATNKP